MVSGGAEVRKARESLRSLGHTSLEVSAAGPGGEIAILSAHAVDLAEAELAAIAAALRPHGFLYVTVELEEDHAAE